jgi:hypothetical protein
MTKFRATCEVIAIFTTAVGLIIGISYLLPNWPMGQ